MKTSTFGCTHIGGKEINQDSFFHISRPDGSAYLGVFDGHCKHGKEVADAVRDHFKMLDMDSGFQLAEEVARQAILKAAGFGVYEKGGAVYRTNFAGYPQIVGGGTTATVVEIKGGRVRVGHVGDSEVMIIHESGKFTVLTNDHSSTSITEWERVQKEAEVIPKLNFAFMESERPVFVRDSHCSNTWKINPLGGARVCNIRNDWSAYLRGENESLNMMRAIGDFSLKKHGVSGRPDFLEQELLPGRSFILVASDGLYDNFTYEGLKDLVQDCVAEASAATCVDVKKATKLILERGMEVGFKNFGMKGQDNMTAVLAIVDIVEPAEKYLARTARHRA